MEAALSATKTRWTILDVIGNNHSTPVLTLKTAGKSPVINDEQLDIMLYVGCVFMSSAFCLFGIFSNIVNIIIFFNQGFKNTVNISLFGIALSDLGAVITLQWVCICMIPAFRRADVPFLADEVHYLTGGIPHVVFCRVTSWFIAFVTIERCLSVTIPLKVKQIITPRRTIISLIFLFIVSVFSFIPEYFVAYFDWKFSNETSRTQVGVVYRENSEAGKFLFILTPFLGMFSFLVVIIFTIILVVQLRQKSKWRQSVTRGKEQSDTNLSARDKNTMKMVIGLACLLIACNIPGVITTSITALVPDFSVLGVYVRLFKGVWAFPFMFQALNASVNIFFYYRMSSNYRQALDRLLLNVCRKPSQTTRDHRNVPQTGA